MRDNCEIFDTKKSLEQHLFQKHLFGKKNLCIKDVENVCLESFTLQMYLNYLN